MDHGMVIKFFGLLIISLYIYMKILDIKDVSKIKIASAVIFSLVMSIPLSYTPFLYEIMFLVSVFSFVCITARDKVSLMISAVIICVGISLGIDMLIQTIIAYGLLFPIEAVHIIATVLRENIPPEDIAPDNVDLILTPVIMKVMPCISLIMSVSFVNILFKIKRLKKGFIFMQSKEARWIGIIFSVIIMICRSFWAIISEYISGYAGVTSLAIFFLLAINICTIGMHFWWRNHTIILYQQRLKERSIQELKAEIDERDKQIKNLSECNKYLSEVIHRDNKLIPAMYNAVSSFIYGSDKCADTETKIRGTHILSELDEIVQERKETILKIQRDHKSLPSTEMERIDNILNYMFIKASEKEIQFDFIIAGSVKNIAERVIPKQKLEAMLADLIENAIIAVSYNEYRKIQVTMGIVDDCYEINVQDSGIPFEIETLIDLGLKNTTTHADNGGSGIGYITIFNILGENNASLSIYEQAAEKYTFSKSIKVRFDGKSEFALYSYRAEKIRSLVKRNDMLVLKYP